MQASKPLEPSTHSRRTYYAVVPKDVLDYENSVIDELIGFAFDKLGASHLDLRISDETASGPIDSMVGRMLQRREHC